MTLSDRIRRAALGPTPKPATLRADWIGIDGVAALRHAFGHGCGLPDWSYSTIEEKRFFLLFVAEALDGLL